MVRVTDSLLPQIAADLGVTVGATSIIVTVYLLAHGSVQLLIGPIADTVGKYRCIALAAAGSTVMVAICGLAPSSTNRQSWQGPTSLSSATSFRLNAGNR